jgi:hypothetical protein
LLLRGVGWVWGRRMSKWVELSAVRWSDGDVLALLCAARDSA